MKFMIMSFENEKDFEARTDNEQKAKYWTDWRGYFNAVREAGILSYPGNILQSGATAHTVKNEELINGSQISAKAQLSGYWIIDVSDFDQAVEWSKRCPAIANGSVEIRPIFEP